MGSYMELLLIASMPVLKFLLISALGLFLALSRINILGEIARHHLNQIVFYVFNPALVCSYLAQTVTFKSFQTMWFMPINIMLTFVIGSVFGWVLGKVTRAPKNMRGLVVAFCSTGNLGAMPIIIIPAICKQKGSPFGAADVCKQYGLAYASLSMAIGSIYIWLYTCNILMITLKKEVVNTNANDSGVTKQPDDETVVSLPEIESFPTSDCSNAAPTNRLPSSSPEDFDRKTPVGDAQNTQHRSDNFSKSTKFLNVLLFKTRQCLSRISNTINMKAVFSPPTIAAAVGFFIGMISPLRKLFFGDNAPLHIIGDTALMIGDATIPSVTLILGANLLQGVKRSTVPFGIIVGIVVVRYIFLPLLGILVVKGAVRAGLVQSENLLLQFVLLIQYALPPALSIGIISQLFGASESESSIIMLWTYAAAPVTFTLWTTFFLWLI